MPSKARRFIIPRPALSFLSDVYLCVFFVSFSLNFYSPHASTAYISWSTFTSLVPTLFYFSVWELGIAGHELFVLSVLSPMFLGFSSLRKWASSRSGLTILMTVEVLGLSAFLLEGPGQRLGAVAVTVAFGVLARASIWAGHSAVDGDGGYQGVCE
jgi:hypothetical protein